ncbi:MAG: stage II sporulation protein M [Candidatus Woesearchaeota archaeon]
MVLEHLFPDNWLEKKFTFSILLASGYSLIGIILARLLFGANSGLASVMFTAILLIPSLRKLFEAEERREEREKKFTLKELYKDNKHLIKAYLGIFIGVYVTYFLVSFISMKLGLDTYSIFKEQVFLDTALKGRATFSSDMFWSILHNNWWVLVACFLLSLISGSGATFFVVWNASAWAVIFAVRSNLAAQVTTFSPEGAAAMLVLITLPHVLLEGGAYILAGIAGAILSDDVISDAKDLKKFLAGAVLAGAGFWLVNYTLKAFMEMSASLYVLRMTAFLGFLYLISRTFHDKKHKEVFIYNYWLFAIALLVFVVGALVETFVLGNSNTLNFIYSAAYQAAG